MGRRQQIGYLGALVLGLSSGCAREHCDWSTVDDRVEIAASGTLFASPLDGVALSPWVGEAIVISTDQAVGSPATDLSVTIGDYPTELGPHPVVASVRISPLGSEEPERPRQLDVAGTLELVDYDEESETNPSDGYTSGGTVTARNIEGSLTLSHEGETARFDFAIEQSLDESCFRCRGIEGCDF